MNMNDDKEDKKGACLKSSEFWNTTPCSPVKVKRDFRGTNSLHLHDQGRSQARNQHEEGSSAAG